jgi:NADH-quinone oxidoreductase subunit J/NAD(P)H-quinone oxidoreductase subunit 6
MIGSAFLVVTMRDIIRCGLAMIVCFGSLAGIYAIIGAPLLAAAQVIVYIGAISVLILFAIMLTQTKDAPSRLVFQTQAVPRRSRRSSSRWILALAIGATDWGEAAKRVRLTAEAMSSVLFNSFVLPFEIVSVLLLAAGHRWRLPGQARTGRAVVSDSLDAYLVLSGLLFAIGTFGFLARRNAISMLMSIELMLNGVNLAIVAFGSFGTAAAAAADRAASVAEGSVIALMVMAVAAAEATVGLAIVIAIYRNKKTPLVDEYDAMRQ